MSAVRFRDGDRVLCTDTTAPYTCAFRPSGADVGRKDFDAVATDTGGQTTTATRTVSVGRFSPRALTLAVSPRSDARLPVVLTSSGRLRLPARVSRRAGCTGRVTVQVKAGRSTISSRRVRLAPDCTWASRVVFGVARRLGDGKLTVGARYAGSEVLGPRSSPRAGVTTR